MRTRNIFASLLSLLLVAAMMVSMAVVPATAQEETDGDISKNLLFHFDFEGDDQATQLADKAPEGSSSTVKDQLTVPEDTNDYTYSTAVKIENGVAMSTEWYGSLRTAEPTADTNAVFPKDGKGTWFVRYKLPLTAAKTCPGGGNAKQGVIVDFRSTAKGANGDRRPLMLSADQNNDRLNAYLNYQEVTVTSANSAKYYTASPVASWVNLAVVYKGLVGNGYRFELYAVTETTVNRIGYTVSQSNKYQSYTDGLILSLFTEYEESLGTIQNWYGISGLEIDDVRYYDIALNDDQLKGIVANEFANELVVHYDFEEANGGVLADKATAGKTADTLSAYSGSKIAVDDYTKHFTIENGVATATAGNAVLMAKGGGKTGDIGHIGDDNTQAVTYYTRFKTPEGYNGAYGAVFDHLHHRSTIWQMGSLFIGSATQLQVGYWQGTSLKINNVWTAAGNADQWMNMAIIRTYNSDSGYVEFAFKLYDDALNLLYTATTRLTAENVSADGEWAELALFGVWHEANAVGTTSPTPSGNILKGVSIDDFRIYYNALSDYDVQALITDNFIKDDICLKGIQTTEVDTTDNTFDLRLVALIRGNQYTSAGFTATISYTDAEGNPHTVENVDLATTNAYLGLNAEGVPNAIKTAPGFYLIAVCITGIPADAKDLTVTFNAYANPIGANAPITTKTAVFSYGATA